LKEKESQLLLENDNLSKERDTLMENFKILEEMVQSLQTEMKQLNELQDHLEEERYDLWKECSQSLHDYENLGISKHNLWVKCENYKKTPKFLNDKLEKNDNLKGQPQDVTKLHQEIESLRETISKFVGSIENIDKLLRYNIFPSNKFEYGYKRNTCVHDKETTICYLYGKIRHITSKCRNLLKTRSSNSFKSNKKRPKRIW